MRVTNTEQPDDEDEPKEFERRAADGFNSTNGRALSQAGATVRMPKIGFLERRFSWEPQS